MDFILQGIIFPFWQFEHIDHIIICIFRLIEPQASPDQLLGLIVMNTFLLLKTSVT